MTSALIAHSTDLLEAVYRRHGATELADTLREAAVIARQHGMADTGVAGFLSLADRAELLGDLARGCP